MDKDHIAIHEFAIPMARFARVARLLMAENPLQGELRSLDLPEFDEIMDRGNCAVRLVFPGEESKSVEYIINENGTRFTTSILPSGFSKKDVIEIHVPQPEPRLFPELKEACSTLKNVLSDQYEDFGCEEVLQAVSAYLEAGKEMDPSTEQTLVYSVISEVPLGPNPENSPDVVQAWAKECRNKLLNDYCHLTISGDASSHAFAVFTYFSISPASDLLFRLGTALIEDVIKSMPAPQKAIAIPILDVGFYLLHPEIVGPDTFVPARRCARLLHRIGDELLREARAKAGVTIFHKVLYQALLYYRTAKGMYRLLLSQRVRESLPPDWYEELIPDPEELQNDHDACEERRVAILTSMTHLAKSRPVPNLTDGVQFFGWLQWLSEQDFSQAELIIRDLDLRLVYPKFLRDLSLGVIQIKQPSLVDKGIANLKKVAELLEENLLANMTTEEVNYLSPTYGLLAKAFTEMGNNNEAQLYAAKSTPGYLQQLSSGFFEG